MRSQFAAPALTAPTARSPVRSAPLAVLGAGAWGTTLAHTLAVSGRPVSLWARDPDLAAAMAGSRENPRYLPGISIHPSVSITSELETALSGAAIVVLAVPTHGMRVIAETCRPLLGRDQVIVSAAKGFEVTTGLTMTGVLIDVLGEAARTRVAVMSGPNLAPEIARGLRAATVVASSRMATASMVRDLCTGSQLRFYSNTDVVGVEYGGALKNVVAIAAGACDGIGGGDNGKAAIITRGLAEMARLGIRSGARPLTFTGLTGLGDCVATSMSGASRNRSLGERIARGADPAIAIVGGVGVAEGVNTSRVAVTMAQRLGVEMPIATEVCAVLFGGKSVPAALEDLMARGTGDELWGLAAKRPRSRLK